MVSPTARAFFVCRELIFIGTPSSKSAVEGIERLPPSISRVLQTPQTPRRTPHPISKFNLNNVESVDLTGDDDNSLEQVSSSPSSSEVFGTSQVIWTEEAAWKPQPSVPSDPHSRGRKKRKSDEISVGSTKKEIFQNCRGGTQRRDERANSGDFMDIDDMMAFRQTPLRPQSDNSRVLSVHPTNETKAKDNFEGEYSMTETTTRVETRRCLSVNRYPSCSESPTVLRIASPPLLPKIGVQAKTDQALTPRPLSMIQITATPAKPSPTRSKQTADKRQKIRQDRIIQDSEDEDEIFSTGGHLKGSPGPSAKSSPKIHKASGTPVWNEIPPFEVGNHKARDEKGTKPRVGSPLRPISRNAAIKQDSAPSPFQRDSPTKVIFATRHPQSSSQQTTPSTESTDDKRLASLFLKGTLTTASYYLRVKNLISQNAITSVSFTDAGEVAPPELKDERIALLTMEKSYVALEDLRERYRATIAKKVVHTSKVLEFLDIGADYSVHEEQSSLLTQEILKIERETARHLHASGAIKDGFGTGLDINDISTITPAPPSDKHEDPNAGPQGSSALGNTQVIFQTQISSLGQNVAGISSQSTREHFAVQSKSTVVSQHGSGWKFSNAPSPSPVRRTTPQEAVEQYHSGKGQSDWMRTKSDLRQPNFSRGPIPVDFPSDGDNAILEDWLRDEQEIQHVNRIRRAVPDDLDDYGECDDDDDMVEFAQEVEHRHSLGEVDLNANPRVALPHASGSIPEPEPLKRTPPVVGRSMYSNVDQDNAAAKRTPWYKEVKKALRERFKLKGFRHHQLDAINATLEGKDAFVLMPTGGGKSLCYQLPAVVQTGKTKGVTVVISPLLSLMSDQVDHLRKLNIRAATLNSEIPADQKREIMNHLREFCPEQFIELLYITPEMINLSGTIQNLLTKLHKNKKLARIVIDEAHCVSQWGHDFRPDYVALGKVRKLFPNVPYMALTATATENVKVDVMHNLGMKDATVYSQSFNRPNLHYAVRSKKGKGKAKEFLDDVVELINREYRNQTGIIYTLSRKSCEQLAKMLQTQYGINAHHFHASMTADDKARVQRQWQNGTIKVVIATIAFGMGIDKPDVRFVIHHTIPKSLEGYYQETGRAGRDGKISGCYLYYGYPDTKILKDFIYKSEGTEEQKERQRKMLQRIVQYCENRSDCRRVQVLHYFGESFLKEECGGTCDNCKSDAVFKTEDFTPQAQAALKIVHNVQDSHVTLLHCVEILRGVATAKIKKLGHESVHGFGAASHISRGEVERIFYRLLMENALAEHNVINRGGFATQYLNVSNKPRY
jgi:bloom syndrome protein